jgi:hypothetical protein
MSESNELLAQVAQLRNEVEDISVMTRSLFRTMGSEERKEVLEEMRRDPSVGAIFLLVDGARSQGEIVDLLKARKVKGASRASVSRKLERLHHDLELIALVRRVKAGNVYRQTAKAEALGLIRALTKGKS